MQPFKVGQKVVFVTTDIPGAVAKHPLPPKDTVGFVMHIEFSDTYESAIKKSAIKKTWYIKFSESPGILIMAKCFAPIDEPKERIRYVAVSETLREQALEIAAIETN